MNYIKTNRLVLIPHTLEAIEAWQNDRSKMERLMGLESYGMQTEEWVQREIQNAFPVWINWLKEFPDEAEWYAGWEIVLREKNRAVGGIGLAGPPDAKGIVLVGYHIDLRHRREGIAEEALHALCEWAFSDARVKAVQATIPDWNEQSIRLAEKCGFIAVDEKQEEGMQLIVFERKR